LVQVCCEWDEELTKLPLKLGNLQPVAHLEVALTTKPIFHRTLQSFQRNTITRLQQSIAYRERIVEDCIIGEIPHGKVVYPANRAGMAPACCINARHRESAHKHLFTLTDALDLS